MAHSPTGFEGGLPALTRADDLPIGVNLSWRIQSLIEGGRLTPKQQLPGVRELAAGAGVNVNTARSVYRRLEDDGLAMSRQGLGTFVAPYAPVAPTLEQFAAQVATDALAQGIDPRQLARALYSGSSAADPFDASDSPLAAGSLTPADARAARVSLRGQIARLEATLAPYPEAEAATAPPPLAPHPHVADLGELEAARDALVAQLKTARANAERRAESQSFARLRREEALADPASHRWEIGSREQMGEPGCGHWQVRPAFGPVGALMNWWRVKISSGCP